MNATRLWALGAIVLIGAVLGLGWFVGVSPLLAQAATADAERATVDTNNVAQRAALEKMKADFADLDAINAELKELRTSIPDAEVIEAFATGVESVTLAHGALLTSVAATELPFLGAAPEGAVAGAGGVATTTPAGSVYAIPVTVTFEGTSESVLLSLRDLQRVDRLFLVTGFTVTAPSTPGEPVEGSVTGYVFLLTDRALASTPDQAVALPEGTTEGVPGQAYQVPDLEEALPEWAGGEGGEPTPAPTPTPTPTP